MKPIPLQTIGIYFLLSYLFLLIVGVKHFTTTTPTRVETKTENFKPYTDDRLILGTLKQSPPPPPPPLSPPLLSSPKLSSPKRQYPILKAYLNLNHKTPWSNTQTTLQLHTYPNATRQQFSCNDNDQDHHDTNNNILKSFPIIDSYPDGDAYLPWIHDVFPNSNGTAIHIIAQNRRRCHTGKHNTHIMKRLEGQIALMQPVAVKGTNALKKRSSSSNSVNTAAYRTDATYQLTSPEDADAGGAETRFLCRFKILSPSSTTTRTTTVQEFSFDATTTTLSRYPFNYEYVTWKKRRKMFDEKGNNDMGHYWLSSIEFHCPVPDHIIPLLQTSSPGGGDGGDDARARDTPQQHVYLDIAAIRTPVRGPDQQSYETNTNGTFDIHNHWGGSSNLVLPSFEDTGRWENIPICSSSSSSRRTSITDTKTAKTVVVDHPQTSPYLSENTIPKMTTTTTTKPYQLVACTWTSAIHNRRGDARTIEDGADRLLEWIAFHLLAGFDHIYVYDNSAANTNVNLAEVTDKFSAERVTRVEWSCKICNNNRPAHDDPGERSSQYAAESSCRSRFGPSTDWMAFMDPDEYFVPMGKFTNWNEILNQESYLRLKILKFRSTRARPRASLMDSYTVSNECHSTTKNCLAQRSNETFLKTYNCEYIKKQIYRPDFVLSHFIHYSTVTTYLANTNTKSKDQPNQERFINELNEGVLVHAKTTPPDEVIGHIDSCRYKSGKVCQIGFPCPNDLSFSDETHKDGFNDTMGRFCNCWVNRKIEDVWMPQLEDALNVLRNK